MAEAAGLAVADAAGGTEDEMESEGAAADDSVMRTAEELVLATSGVEAGGGTAADACSCSTLALMGAAR